MTKFQARLTNEGILLGFRYYLDNNSLDMENLLSRNDLLDYIDSDCYIVYNNEEIHINNYLGGSTCFYHRYYNQ